MCGHMPYKGSMGTVRKNWLSTAPLWRMSLCTSAHPCTAGLGGRVATPFCPEQYSGPDIFLICFQISFPPPLTVLDLLG